MSDNRYAMSPDSRGEHGPQANGHPTQWNTAVDICAAALLLVALIVPWNVSFGIGIPNSSGWLFGLLITATLLSLGALAVSRAGRRGNLGVRFSSSADTARVCLSLNAPYLLMVLGFVVFTVVQSIRYGGTGDVPPGIGPGAMAGVAGALLAAQPVIAGTEGDDHRFRPWLTATRVIGIAAIVLATLSVLFNLYWRIHYVVPNLSDATFRSQNFAVVATAVVYGAVPLVGVVVGLRWLLQNQRPARLATTALGTATLLGSILVWSIGAGRNIDAFHGIAQNTSTAAVGFEGYLAWAAAAAIVAPITLLAVATARPLDKAVWQEAMRKCLLLIAVWCVGSAVLRIFDLIVAVSLGLPFSPYDSMALVAFDVVAAVVAVWVRINVANAALQPVVISALCGVLFVLTICRVAVGVGLAPRILYLAPPEGLDTAVYGNTLAQQITSTFDVVLCALALAVLGAAVIVIQLGGLRRRVRAAPLHPPKPAAEHQEPAASTQHRSIAAQGGPAGTETTEQLNRAPRIFAGPDGDETRQVRRAAPDDESTQQLPTGAPKIARILEESTQRFSTGTTYTGSGRQQLPPASGSAP